MSSAAILWEDNFWGEGNRGYQVLSERLDSGATSLKEISDFLTSRSKAEAEYAANLISITSSCTLSSDEGTLRRALDKMLSLNETIGKTHALLCTRLATEIEEKLGRFREEQLKIRQDNDAEMDRVNKAVQRETSNVDRLKKDYYGKCTVMVQAVQLAGRGQGETMTKKEFEKIQERAIKAKKDVDLAEAEYKASIKKLDESQDAWDKKMFEVARSCQKMEEDRLVLTKKILKKAIEDEIEVIANIKTGCLTKMSKHIEDIDATRDIDQYGTKLKTGSQKPPRQTFQNYFSASVASRQASFAQQRSRISQSGTSSPFSSALDLSQVDRQGSSDNIKSPNGEASLLSRLSNLSRSKSIRRSSGSLHASVDDLKLGVTSPKASKGSQDLKSPTRLQNSESAEIVVPAVPVPIPSGETIVLRKTSDTTKPVDHTVAESVEVVAELPRKLTITMEVQKSASVDATKATVLQEDVARDSGIFSAQVKASSVTSPQTADEPVASKEAQDLSSAASPVLSVSPTDLTETGTGHDAKVERLSPVISAADVPEQQVTNLAEELKQISLEANLEAVPEVIKAEPDVGSHTEIVAQAETAAAQVESVLKTAAAPAVETSNSQKAEIPRSASQTSFKTLPKSSSQTSLDGKRSFSRRTIKMEGWLDVCDEAAPEWTKRWCAVEGGYIWMFADPTQNSKSQGMNKPKAMVSLSKFTYTRGIVADGWDIPEAETKQASTSFTCSVGGKKRLVLTAPNEEDFKYWEEALEMVTKKK